METTRQLGRRDQGMNTRTVVELSGAGRFAEIVGALNRRIAGPSLTRPSAAAVYLTLHSAFSSPRVPARHDFLGLLSILEEFL